MALFTLPYPFNTGATAEMASRVTLAVDLLFSEIARAETESPLPADFVLKVNSTLTGLAAQLTQSTQTTPELVAEQLNNTAVQVESLGANLASLTGRSNVTIDALHAGETSSPWGTLLVVAVAGLAGWYVYKWATQTEAYPRHLIPRYAGGRRR